jgi:hypothetical protein
VFLTFSLTFSPPLSLSLSFSLTPPMDRQFVTTRIPTLVNAHPSFFKGLSVDQRAIRSRLINHAIN